ncbi:AAA family ATPase [Bacillus sp. UNCCL81]|uniref:AAA family ATPase n=1 Tax=Bacillus sp. UNCCL81 TaxID=1502755 RepID=UPI0008E160F4|nr:AAA family ATPase [Bacillus sp. UNCCL81]SFD44742.1 AAA domain-containing protein [Bacillus sp. UNCCL81]
MKISFEFIQVINFKNHKDLAINLKDITNIEGRNGAGKSTIGDAPTWLLFGTDINGNKLDPKPIGEDDAETTVLLVLNVDGKEFQLAKSQKKTAKYFINEVPEKATKFNELVSELFDKDLFLSIFNPTYFSSQNWQDQRKQLLQYVPEPLNKEVFAELHEMSVSILEAEFKKHNIDDLEKIHRDQYNKLDKSSERAGERVVTLREQLEKFKFDNLDRVNEKTLQQLEVQKSEINKLQSQNQQVTNKISTIRAKMSTLYTQLKRQREKVMDIKNEEININCSTCGQSLNEESIGKVKKNKQLVFSKEVEYGKELSAEYSQFKMELEELENTNQIPIDQDLLEQINNEIIQIKTQLNQVNQVERLKAELIDAEANKEDIRTKRNKSLAIIDAIKEFRTKRSELMVKKIDSLFTNISVKLFEQLKNGEERATFEIEMHGRPFSKLSTAERIKCGLELSEVLLKQSELIAPTFVDNAESILKFSKPTGQLIVARVVDTDFNIKTIQLEEEVVNV